VPNVVGYIPVIIALRAGAQTGTGEKALVKTKHHSKSIFSSLTKNSPQILFFF